MYCGFVADVDADIEVCSCHVRHHVKRGRERPELPQKIHDELHVHRIDETSVVADNPLRARSNAPDAEHIFCVRNHLCHLMERQSISQILCNQLKPFGVADNDGIPTDTTGIY